MSCETVPFPNDFNGLKKRSDPGSARAFRRPVLGRLTRARYAGGMTGPTAGASGPPPLPRDIPGLTSLRFFASFWVVILHARALLPLPVADYTHVVLRGGLAVDFFFILSGFILSQAYAGHLARGTFDTLRFFQKRLARIYPMHFVTLAAFVALVIVYPDVRHWAFNSEIHTLKYVIEDVLLVHNWGNVTPLNLNFPTWSLSAEWFAYILFPASMAAALRLRVRPSIQLAGVAAVIGGLALVSPDVFGQPFNTFSWRNGILRTLPEFLLGMALHRFTVTAATGVVAARFAYWGSGAAILATAHFAGRRYFAVIGFAVLIFAVAVRARHRDRCLLDARALVYLGQISYSVFIVHLFIMTVTAIALDGLLGSVRYLDWQTPLWFASIALVYAVSALTYRAIELPCRRLFGPRTVAPVLDPAPIAALELPPGLRTAGRP